MTREQKPRKARRRRASVRIGGTSQSRFANRSMSDFLGQPPPAGERGKPAPAEGDEPGDREPER